MWDLEPMPGTMRMIADATCPHCGTEGLDHESPILDRETARDWHPPVYLTPHKCAWGQVEQVMLEGYVRTSTHKSI